MILKLLRFVLHYIFDEFETKIQKFYSNLIPTQENQAQLTSRINELLKQLEQPLDANA